MPVELSGSLLEDAKALRADLTAAGLPVGAWAAKCHSFVSPAEREPGVGHVLVSKAEWDRVPDQTKLTLTFTDHAGVSVSFRQLHVVSGPTPLPREYQSADSLLWLTLEDRRSRFALVAVKRAYNLRVADGSWDAGTLNAGTPWTWAGVLSDLWAKLKAVYADLPSSAPALPSTPSGTPESFSFYAVDAWTAYCTVAQAGGLLAVFDPTADDGGSVGPVSLIDPSATPDAETAAAIAARTWDTAAWVAYPEAVPAAVTVSYRRIGRADSHQIDAAISETGTTSGAAVVLPAYPAAAGDPVSNTTYLTAFAGRVRDFWRRDWAARTEPRAVQYRGYQTWPKAVIGRGGWARWGVSELAGDEVQTSAAMGPLLRLDPGDVWLSDVTARDRLIDVCLVFDSYGVIIGLRKTFERPDGTTYCEDAAECPEDGCGDIWYCVDGVATEVDVGSPVPTGTTVSGPYRTEVEALEACPLPPQEIAMCCESPVLFPNALTLSFVNKTGVYATLPNSVSIDLDEASGGCSSSSCFWEAFVTGGVIQVNLTCNETNKYLGVRFVSCGDIPTPNEPFWTDLTGLAGDLFVRQYTCADTDLSAAALNAEPFLGSYTATPAVCLGTGTVDVYAFWE